MAIDSSKNDNSSRSSMWSQDPGASEKMLKFRRRGSQLSATKILCVFEEDQRLGRQGAGGGAGRQPRRGQPRRELRVRDSGRGAHLVVVLDASQLSRPVGEGRVSSDGLSRPRVESTYRVRYDWNFLAA